MGAGASLEALPATEEEALAAGFTQDQIDSHKRATATSKDSARATLLSLVFTGTEEAEGGLAGAFARFDGNSNGELEVDELALCFTDLATTLLEHSHQDEDVKGYLLDDVPDFGEAA